MQGLFFVLIRSVIRGSDLVLMKVSTLSIYFLCTFLHSPHILFSKNPVFMRLFSEKKCVYKKVLTNHQHYTINTNYKHKIRSNDRIFSFLLGFMVIFSRRCTVSLSLKNTSKINCAAFFLRLRLLTSLSFYFRFFYCYPRLLPLKFKNGF